MNRRVTARGIIIHDGKLLCVKLKPYKGAITGDYWCVPGGGVDPGEALIPALSREIVEETGVEPQIGNLLYLQQFTDNDTEQLELFFQIINTKDFLEIDLAKTSHGEKEIAEIEFIDPTQHVVLPKFLTEEDFSQVSSSQSVKLFNYL